MGVDGFGWAVPVGVPHILKDLGAGVHCTDAAGQVCQQVELLGGQRDLVIGDAHPARSSIKFHRPDSLWTGVVAFVSCGRPFACPTGHGTNPGDKLSQAERLGDVVVGTQLQTQDTIELLAARRQHDDRRLRLLAQLAADVAAVHVGQAEIKQHQFVAAFRQRPGARRDMDDGVAGGVEPFDQGLGDGPVVFDQQQFHPAIVTRPAELDEFLGQILDVRVLSLGRGARTVTASKDHPSPSLFGGKALTMKSTIATTLSLAGVLVAGSAAALVNTHVLSGGSSPSSFVVAAAPAAAPVVNAVADPVAATTVAPAALPPVTVPAAAAAAAAAPTQAMYRVGGSGTVTLDTAGDVLKIVNVAPADGWSVTKSELNDSLNAEVRLRSAAGEVEFHANLLFGVVTPSVSLHDGNETTNSVADPSSGGSSGKGTGSGGSGKGGGGHGSDDSGHGGGSDD
jgi:hypothetical protein